MRTWNIKIIAASSLLLILAMAIAAGAQQGQQVRAANKDGIAQNLGIQEFLRGLRLTETQRQAIKPILQSHRADILNTREALLRARLALITKDVGSLGNFGDAQEKTMELRLRIFNEIETTVLTADQRAVLQERQKRQAERLANMLERLRQRGAN